MHTRSASASITVYALDRSWELARPADLETLWESLGKDDFGEDERLPYWTELWPASLALAEWLRARQETIRGAVCLDMGCGLGLTAMIGAFLGARVLGMDYEPNALRYAGENARRNLSASERTRVAWAGMDWRCPAVLPGTAKHIWAGDIMYERRFIEPVARFLEHALSSSGAAWIAEPGRNIYASFQRYMERTGWDMRQAAALDAPSLVRPGQTVPVQVWELRRPGAAAFSALPA